MSDPSHRSRSPDLRRIVAVLAAWLSLGAVLLTLTMALVTRSPQMLPKVASPLIVSALGFSQLRRKRYNAQLILLTTAGLAFLHVALYGSDTRIAAATVTLVAVGVVWTTLIAHVRWWHLALYSGFLLTAMFIWEERPFAETITIAFGPIAAFVGASLITSHLRRSVGATQRRYLDLFSRSPIALWEEDFSRVREALDELRSQGIQNLRRHLEEYPGELERLVALIEILDVNEAAVELLGAGSRDELIGRLPRPQMESARQSFTEQLVAVWDGKDEFEYEFVGETRNGRDIDLIIRWSVRSSGEPDYRHVILAMSDITEPKRAERALQESRDRFERLAANAADVITRLRLHPEPLWEYVSPAIERMTGYTPEDFYADGYIMRRITHPDDRAKLAEFMRHPERWDEALTIRTIAASGKEVWAEMRMTPVYEEDGTLSFIETVSRDVTERKEYEQRLEELIRSKDEFVASVSHELRTPLTAVVGLAHELRDNWARFRPAEVSELIETIAGQATEVADIVNDLLVAARADIGLVSIRLETIDLATEACSVVAALTPEQQRRVDTICEGTICMADPTRVRQIIRNLLTNAFRYGGQHIQLVTGSSDGMAKLEVRDNGPGVPHKDVERIFDPYQRAHPDASQPASVGLGLTVSRRLARLMQGDVVYQRDNGLSIFVLTLPLVRDEQPVDPAQLSPSI